MKRKRQTQREDNVMRHREKMAVFQPTRDAENRFFPCSSQEEPTLLTPVDHGVRGPPSTGNEAAYNLQNLNTMIKFMTSRYAFISIEW